VGIKDEIVLLALGKGFRWLFVVKLSSGLYLEGIAYVGWVILQLPSRKTFRCRNTPE
jgi:hypothetical protein